MFRIHFEANGAYWCIQFAAYHGLFWRTLRGKYKVPAHMNAPETTEFGILQFDSYADAQKYVCDRGIDKAYKQQSRSPIYADTAVSEQTEELVARLHDILQRDRKPA